MNARSGQITNWHELARQANWHVETLARQCDVSVRTLERWFRQTKGMEPRKWLHQERHQHGLKLLKDGSSVKETAAGLGYQTQQHFSREFKKNHGYPPSKRLTQKSNPAL